MNSDCKLSSYNTLSSGGYARLRIGGKLISLTRYLYSKHHKIPLEDMEGKVIMHTCDTPKCINLSHLKLATQQENVQDMWNKGRQGVKGMKGSEHPMSKLTEDTVRQIKQDKTATGKTLAIRYGVSRATISMIRTGKIWTEVKI